jgi:hypothetical protein
MIIAGEWQQADGMPEHQKHLFGTAQTPLQTPITSLMEYSGLSAEENLGN